MVNQPALSIVNCRPPSLTMVKQPSFTHTPLSSEETGPISEAAVVYYDRISAYHLRMYMDDVDIPCPPLDSQAIES